MRAWSSIATDVEGEDGQIARDFRGYAQRAGESGLSQEFRLTFVGWTESEAADFVRWLSGEVHHFNVTRSRVWGD